VIESTFEKAKARGQLGAGALLSAHDVDRAAEARSFKVRFDLGHSQAGSKPRDLPLCAVVVGLDLGHAHMDEFP
jgi:hypothetical protein